MDMRVKLCNTELYKKGVINMGTSLYKNLSGFMKEIDYYKAFEKELKLFLLHHSLYSVEEFIFLAIQQ